jgi:hypothetical protein
MKGGLQTQMNGKPTKENPDPCLHMGHDSTTLHKKPRPRVIRGEPVIKKRKLSNVTISSEPTTSESFDNESISNSQPSLSSLLVLFLSRKWKEYERRVTNANAGTKATIM